MRDKNFSAAIPHHLHEEIAKFLLRDDLEEELVFGLWRPSESKDRYTGLVYKIIYPEDGDRQRHGSVSFNVQYLERVCEIAQKEEAGIVFMHSHPEGSKWQGMSDDDINAEKGMLPPVGTLTGLPLIGMTLAGDRKWSARFWLHKGGKEHELHWASSVRVVGRMLDFSFNDKEVPTPKFDEMFKRTITVWGEENHNNMARARIGIVGLGSVGIMVAKILAKMGMQNFTLLDFDEVQRHNLDRLDDATLTDVGKLKIDIGKRIIENFHTAASVNVDCVPFSVVENEGYEAVLDCDVIFCCVDRPHPRRVLDNIAYAHLIPVINGGIGVRFNDKKELLGIEWQAETVAPNKPCMECLGSYDLNEVALEQEGKLDDPSYMKGLPDNHHLKTNENVFTFSVNLASMEVMQFVALVTGVANIHDFGVQRFYYHPGIMEADKYRLCKDGCGKNALLATGDKVYKPSGKDFSAEEARKRQRKSTSK